MPRLASTRRSHIVRLVMASLVLAWAAAGPASAQTQPDRIVVFGDSLSDSGNAFALTKEGLVPPDYSLDALLIPGAPYARGGHHLSNGHTWIEQLARSMGLAGSVRPAFQGSNSGATNYAVGAARAYEDGRNVNLSTQVSAFLQDVGGVAPSDALYVIQLGGNDVRDALTAYQHGLDGGLIIQAALMSIGSNITKLYAAGARTFLVWNVPNIGLTPALRLADTITPGAAAFATFVTQSFNNGLMAILAPLSALSGIAIVPFDAFALITAIVANPAVFGLTNATAACVTPHVPPFACQNPDEFLFWDGIHPTRAGHAIIAQRVASLLGL